MSEKFSSDARTARSLQRAVREGNAYSVMAGVGESYFAAYALFLKATTSHIAFLASVPALLGSFAQLFSAWLGHRLGHRKPIIIAGVTMQALAWLPMIWLPYFFPDYAVPLLLGFVVLYYAGANIASPGWLSLMGDLVPEDQRGRYFGHRSRAMNLTTFIAMATGGVVLHFAELGDRAHIGFLSIFTLAMGARLYSAYQVHRIPDPGHHAAAAAADGAQPRFRDLIKEIRGTLFARYVGCMAALNFAAGIAGPFFAVYMLRDLEFSYLEFMLSSAVVVIMQFLTLGTWGRLSDKFGNRVVMAATGYLIAVVPLLWLFTSNFWAIIVIQLIGGLSWAGFNLSSSNFLYDTVQPQRRAPFSAMHNVVGAVAIFAGAALGGYLATHLPQDLKLLGFKWGFESSLVWLFLLSSVGRLYVAAMLMPRLREVRSVPKISRRQLLSQAFGLSAFVALCTALVERVRIR